MLLNALLLFFAQAAPSSSVQGTGDSFIKNNGQWPQQVLFLARGQNLDYWITDKGVVLDQYRMTGTVGRQRDNAAVFSNGGLTPVAPEPLRQGHVVSMAFVGASQASAAGDILVTPSINYIKPEGSFQTSSYEQALSHNLYPGISARYYWQGTHPRYDLLLEPGADSKNIRIQYHGVQNLGVTASGQLSYLTTLGRVTEKDLVAYQDSAAGRVLVPCSIRIDPNGNVGFSLGAYDRAKRLVIDPLVYSTYLGSGSEESAYDITADAGGNSYVTGYTVSAGFPASTGAYDKVIGDVDAYVAKVSPSGATLNWCTFFGGSSREYGSAIVVDSAGLVTVGGETNSSDLPTSVGAYDRTYNGWYYDAFVTRFSSDGKALMWSTYLGGGATGTAQYTFQGEELRDLVARPDGAVYAVGNTESADFPVTAGAHQTTFKSGREGYVARISADGKRLVASTFLGGDNNDYPSAAVLDISERVVVAGGTWSSNFATTLGAYDRLYNGFRDGFVLCLSGSLTSLAFSTYIGGAAVSTGGQTNSDGEMLTGLGLGLDGSISVTGYTNQPDFPTSSHPYQKAPGGLYDMIAFRLDAAGKTLLWSTFIGGPGNDYCFSGGTASDGSIVLGGQSASGGFPITPDAFDRVSADYEALLVRLGNDGRELLWSTYLGGNGGDGVNGIKVLSSGASYVCGYTGSNPFPTTQGTIDRTYGGNFDAFVAKVPSNGGTNVITANYLPLESLRDEKDNAVVGVVCDGNGDAAKASTITFKLTGDWSSAKVFGSVKDPGGNSRYEGVDYVGSIVGDTGLAKFIPPQEFNVDQSPENFNEVTKAATRKVRVTLYATLNGETVRFPAKEITLARPPVVLIHGINTGPDGWDPLIEAYGSWVPFTRVNHFDKMNGNAYVEYGALRLRDKTRRITEEIPKGTFDGFQAGFTKFDGLQLACKRADVLGWSYGGVVARWYLSSNYGNPNWKGYGSFEWYERPLRENYDDVERAVRSSTDPLKYLGNIRKLVTFGSMWRGVPLCNYLNEARGLGGVSSPDLGSSLLTDFAKAYCDPDKDLRDFVLYNDAPDKDVPSTEVMAVDSPWLWQLIYGTPTKVASPPAPKPFITGVSYATVGGVDQNYEAGPFGIPLPAGDQHLSFSRLEIRPMFSYTALETRRGLLTASKGFNDGIVPIWSSTVPGNSAHLVECDHSDYPKNDDARQYAMRMFSDCRTKLGPDLNAAWQFDGGYVESMARSEGGRFRWTFSPNSMAPAPQRDIYDQVKGAGRIRTEYVDEVRDLVGIKKGLDLQVTWTTKLQTGRHEIVYGNSVLGWAKANLTDPNGAKNTHSFTLSGVLLPLTNYRVRIVSFYETYKSGVKEREVPVSSSIVSVVSS